MLSPARRAGGDKGGMSWPDAAERSEGTLVADEHCAQIERRWPQRCRSETKPNADLTDGRAFEGLRWTRRGVGLLDCGAVGDVAVKSFSEPALVVRVDLR